MLACSPIFSTPASSIKQDAKKSTIQIANNLFINIKVTLLWFETRSCLHTDPKNVIAWIIVSTMSCIYIPNTHAKTSHLVASLQTNRKQVVFALLVPSCQQVWNKLLTTCYNLADNIRLVAKLFQQVWHSHDITILLHYLRSSIL
jgi:hypothetical protein